MDDLQKLDEVYSNEVTEHSAKVVDDILSLKSPEMLLQTRSPDTSTRTGLKWTMTSSEMISECSAKSKEKET